MHKATQTVFQHFKVVPNPPDFSPLLQRCLNRALNNRAAAHSSLLQDPSPRLAPWLPRLPQGVCSLSR